VMVPQLGRKPGVFVLARHVTHKMRLSCCGLTHPWHLRRHAALNGNTTRFWRIWYVQRWIREGCTFCNADLRLDKINVQDFLCHSVLDLSGLLSVAGNGTSLWPTHIRGFTSMK
jgi:hypothetical protein